MYKELPIYIQDFTEKAQKRIAEFYGVENISDLNYEFIPIMTLCVELEEDK